MLPIVNEVRRAPCKVLRKPSACAWRFRVVGCQQPWCKTGLDFVRASLSRSTHRVSTRKRWRVHFVEHVIDFNARSGLNPRMPLQGNRTKTESFIWLSSSISNNPSTIIWAPDDSAISQKGGQLQSGVRHAGL